MPGKKVVPPVSVSSFSLNNCFETTPQRKNKISALVNMAQNILCGQENIDVAKNAVPTVTATFQ